MISVRLALLTVSILGFANVVTGQDPHAYIAAFVILCALRRDQIGRVKANRDIGRDRRGAS